MFHCLILQLKLRVLRNLLWPVMPRPQCAAVAQRHTALRACLLPCLLCQDFCKVSICQFGFLGLPVCLSMCKGMADVKICEVSCKVSGEIMRDSLLLGKAEHWYCHKRRGTSADTSVTEFTKATLVTNKSAYMPKRSKKCHIEAKQLLKNLVKSYFMVSLRQGSDRGAEARSQGMHSSAIPSQ